MCAGSYLAMNLNYRNKLFLNECSHFCSCCQDQNSSNDNTDAEAAHLAVKRRQVEKFAELKT